MKTILCFSHEQNTFDKRKLLDNPHPDYVKESTKKITDFIRFDKEANIKKFFMDEIDPLLEKYEPGNPRMKPDVLKQIAEIERDREKMMQEEMAKNGQIMLNQPGKPPVPMTMPQIAEMLTKQGEQIHVYERRIVELESINANLQKLLMENAVKKHDNSVVYGPELQPKAIQQPYELPKAILSKSEPLFKLDPTMI
jgi:hypothetical protein